MSIGLGEALLGWLVASAGDGLVSRLRGNPAQAALRTIVEEAVAATVAQAAGDLDAGQVEHLRSSLLGYGIGHTEEQRSVSNEADLRHAVNAWTAALDEAPFGGLGYLTGLGVDPQWLGGELADHIVAGIHRDARGSGALESVAAWLWRDGVTDQLARIVNKIDAVAGPAEPVGGGLPGGIPDFVGRQQALDELARRVQAHDPDGIVVAIHAVDGMAGVGKTQLTLRAAHQHKHRYPGGQFFLNLHGYTEGIPPMSPAVALGELLHQAGVPAHVVPPDVAGRQARWRSLMAHRQALVLLDNVLDVEQVRPLLPGAAGCLVLITSRTRLSGLAGVRPLRLDVLRPTEAVELFTRLVDTARPVDPRVGAAVVDHVGRLPVAIHAVAGLVDGSYTEFDLADELVEIKSGVGPMDQAGGLNGGVHAAFETSLRRLDQPHQRAFCLLGVHPGPSVGVPQFAALADLPIVAARALLRGLADRNLIMPSPDRIGHHRYQMHDLLRIFARGQAVSRLTAADRTAAIGRLARWYAAAMGTVARLRGASGDDVGGSGAEGLALDRPAGARQWMAAERDNLLAFAETTTGAPAADACRRAARNLYDLDYHATAEVLYQAAAEGYRLAGDRRREASAQRGLGQVARDVGDYPRAAEHYEAALRICAEIGDRLGVAATQRRLGQIAEFTGDYPRAAEHYEAALRICAEIDDRQGVAATQRRIGDVARATGDHLRAAEHYRAAQRTCREIGYQRGEAAACRRLGDVALAVGDYPRAAEHFRAARRTYAEIGDRVGESATRRRMGRVAEFTGDYSSAAGHFRAAERTCREMGDRGGEAAARRGLGDVGLAVGDYAGAAEHFRVAFDADVEIGNPRGEAAACRRLGDVALAVGDFPRAAEHFRAARRTYAEIGDGRGEAAAQRSLGDVALAGGDYSSAAGHFRAAERTCREMGDRGGEAAARRGLGDVALAVGDYAGAAEHLRAARVTYVEIGHKRGEAKALWRLGDVANERGRGDEARASWGDALRCFEEIGDPLAASVREALGRQEPA